MSGEDETFLAEADFPANNTLNAPTYATDGIYLSKRVLSLIASDPAKYLVQPSAEKGAKS
jgi:hypothetical protein